MINFMLHTNYWRLSCEAENLESFSNHTYCTSWFGRRHLFSRKYRFCICILRERARPWLSWTTFGLWSFCSLKKVILLKHICFSNSAQINKSNALNLVFHKLIWTNGMVNLSTMLRIGKDFCDKQNIMGLIDFVDITY